MSNVVTQNKQLYCVTGLAVSKYDAASRFTQYTHAASAKQAIFQVRYRLAPRFGRGFLLRDVDVQPVSQKQNNSAKQLALF